MGHGKKEKRETMTRIKRNILTVFLIFTLTLMCSCKKKDEKVIFETPVFYFADKSPTIRVDTFSTFPLDIDGCSCYFSNDSIEFKRGEYIYINDFAKTSYMKVEGVLTQFKQTEYKQTNKITVAKFVSIKYEMIIEVIDTKKTAEKNTIKRGTIKLTDGKITITKKIYGECGC